MSRRQAWLPIVALLTLPVEIAARPLAVMAPEQPITLYELVLRDSSRLFGSVEREDENEIVFKTRAGAVLTVKRAEIDVLKPVTGSVVDGEFMPSDPNATRLFFAPTGRSLPRGQVYLGVYEFLMPFVQVGVTDRFSIGGGTPLLFGIDEADRPFWITPKLNVLQTRATDVAVGVFHLFNADGGAGGVAYVVSTSGTARGSFTIGGGLAYGEDRSRAGVIMIGGDRQVRRNLKLVTESYLWHGAGIASAGVRFFGERLSADLGLGVPLGGDEVFALPVVNFVYRF
jgi:hypothetical protein